MRAPMPNFPCVFEIPDEWWVAAGMAKFYRGPAGLSLDIRRQARPAARDRAAASRPREAARLVRF